jgi:hypothetical protein
MLEEMDVVYICRSGPNEELRYSIRSVEKHMPHKNIWVIGQKPEWYQGNFIEVENYKAKYLNARANLKTLVDSDYITDDFILMNDDFFIMRKIETISYFYHGTLEERAEANEQLTSTGSYTRMLNRTNSQLLKMGIEKPLNYELHIPMVMNRQKLKKIIKYEDCLWRSMYGNVYAVGGIEREDVKVYPPNTRNPRSYEWRGKRFPYLSTQDASFPEIHRERLSRLFKHSSSIEDEDED